MSRSQAELVAQTELAPSRHAGLIAPGLTRVPIWVIGCGTIGSWIIHNLTRLGFQNISAWDYDRVGPENIPSQCFAMSDTVDPTNNTTQARGRRKPDAIRLFMDEVMGENEDPAIIARIYSEFSAETYQGDFNESSIVISAVDSLEARRAIATAASEARVHRFMDYRMGALFGSVLFVGPMAWDAYFETLDVPFIEEAECGARSFLPTAHFLVGVGMAHWLAIERGATRGRHRLNIDAVTGTVVNVREKAVGE